MKAHILRGSVVVAGAGLLLVFSTRSAVAQTAAPPQSAAPPSARAEDVASVNAIITALYDVISGPAGTKRDWDRFRSLFAPGARLIPIGRRPSTADTDRVATRAIRVSTPEEYAANATPFFEKNGFYEREIARVSDEYGGLTHLFSTYESRHAATDSLPFARGINSIQVMNDGKRWWVVTIMWEAERPDNPIPGRNLRRP